MLGVEVSSDIHIDAADVESARKQRLKDAADKGFAVSQELVPQDRGTLQQSGFQPEWRGGDLVYGYTAPYAAPQEFGTDPFFPPLEPLLEWSERVTGDKGLGFYVAREKIPEEGVDAHPYLRPSAEQAQSYLDTHPLDDYL